MYELKKNGKVLTSKSVGTGPSSYEKRIYRAAVSQRLRNTAVDRSQALQYRRRKHVSSIDENTYVNIDIIYNLMNPPPPPQIKMVDTAIAAHKAVSNFRFVITVPYFDVHWTVHHLAK